MGIHFFFVMKKKTNYFLKFFEHKPVFEKKKKKKDLLFFGSQENFKAQNQIENRQFSSFSGNVPLVTFGISHYCQCHLSSC